MPTLQDVLKLLLFPAGLVATMLAMYIGMTSWDDYRESKRPHDCIEIPRRH